MFALWLRFATGGKLVFICLGQNERTMRHGQENTSLQQKIKKKIRTKKEQCEGALEKQKQKHLYYALICTVAIVYIL